MGLEYDQEPHLVEYFLNIRWSLSIVYSAIYEMNYNININNNAHIYYYHYYEKTCKYLSLLLLSIAIIIINDINYYINHVI